MKTQQYGVPMDSSRPRIMMPISSHKFKLAKCHEQITQNVLDAKFNFSEKTLTINVRITVDPESFQAAMEFADSRRFAVDMDSYYRIQPENLKLVDHTLSFDYSVSAPALHQYKWSYSDISIMVNEDKAPPPLPAIDDDGFVTPAKALESLVTKNNR